MPDVVNYNEDNTDRFQKAANLTDDEVTAYLVEIKEYLNDSYDKVNMVLKEFTSVPLSKPYPDGDTLLRIEADIAAGRWLEDHITPVQGERPSGGKGRHHVHQRGLDDLDIFAQKNYTNYPASPGGEGVFEVVDDDSPFTRDEW